MKERGGNEQREEREIWSRASSTLHSCHVLAQFIASLSAASTLMQTAQKLGTSTGLKSDTECPAGTLLLLALLLYTT